MKFIKDREVIYNLCPKLHARHEGFYGPTKSDEGADTDLKYNSFWPNLPALNRFVRCLILHPQGHPELSLTITILHRIVYIYGPAPDGRYPPKI